MCLKTMHYGFVYNIFLFWQYFGHRIEAGIDKKSYQDGHDRAVDNTRNDVGADQFSFVSAGACCSTDGDNIIDADHISDGTAHILEGDDEYLWHKQQGCRLEL